TRYRPKILVNEDSLTVGGASARGEWHKAYVLGESNTTEITVAGWRENGPTGPLWQPNLLVPVTDTIQQLDVTWLIKTVSFMEGDSGRLTVLTLAPPESLDMPSQKAKKKGKKTSVGSTWD
ncbi:phage baseplate assembly protein, partial [Enterobacter hormaechei]